MPGCGVNAAHWHIGTLHLLFIIFAAMSIAEIAQTILTQLRETTPLEAIAVVFGTISVLLAQKNHVWLYPTGIVSTVIFIYLFAKPSVGLYAEALLNGYYLVMSIYGWLRWNKRHENESATAVSVNSRREWVVTISIVFIGWLVLYLVLNRFTDSNVPVMDAIVSSTAWAGMWLLARHKLENWVLLNISNAIAIPLLIYKGLYFTSLHVLLLFIVAIFGYFHWRKLYRLSHASH